MKQLVAKQVTTRISTIVSYNALMLITTTPTVEGRSIIHYRGLVAGEAIIGANIFRDMLASMRDIVGGRSRAYEQALEKARQVATEEMVARATAMKANAVIGVDIDYEVFGEGGMMMVSLSGTAVLLSGEIPQGKPPTTKG